MSRSVVHTLMGRKLSRIACQIDDRKCVTKIAKMLYRHTYTKTHHHTQRQDGQAHRRQGGAEKSVCSPLSA